MTTAIHYDAERREGLRLRAWLEMRPPTQAEIARQAGVSRQYIHMVLNGEARPTARILKACAELGVPVDMLIGRTDPQKASARLLTGPKADAETNSEKSITTS